MRVYISGPITGNESFMEQFAKAEDKLIFEQHRVINPAKLDDVLPKELSYEEHMEIDILLLSMSEAIYMLKGWEKSCGANREYGYALAAGKVILFEE